MNTIKGYNILIFFYNNNNLNISIAQSLALPNLTERRNLLFSFRVCNHLQQIL
ncbi:hypothetical protein POKO110462_10190 [Pontibacter korlensis]